MTNILFFVEDDGAANMLRGLRPRLTKLHHSVAIAAVGPAAKKLRQLGEEYVDASDFSAKALLKKIEPRLLAVGTAENKDTLALPLVAAARQSGVPSLGLIDANANADRRWRGRTDDPLAYMPDYLVVADAAMQQAYVDLGISPERVLVIGHVHADYIQAEAPALAAQPRLWGEGPTVVFLAEQFNGLDERLPHRERSFYAFQTLCAALDAINPRPYFVLRLHPKNARDDFAAYEEAVDYVSQDEASLRVVYSGDVIVGITSTLLFEAALLGRPTLALFRPGQEERWLPSIAEGVTLIASTAAEARELITTVFSGAYHPPARPALWQSGARDHLASYMDQLIAHD